MGTVFRFKLEDRISQCALWGRTPKGRSLAVSRLVFHRCGPGFSGWVGAVRNADDVARVYAEHKDLRHAVGRMPYHFFVRLDGVVQQAVRLSHSVPHARLYEYNQSALAVGVHGDFRKHEPTPEQFAACCELAAMLCAWFGKPLRITGHHPDLQGSSVDPAKVCPGEHLDIGAIDDHARHAVLRGDWPRHTLRE